MTFWMVAACGMAACLTAAEPYQAFLDALRSEREYDLAMRYLDRIEARPQTPAEIRVGVPLQRARLACDAAAEEADLARRLALYETAQSTLASANIERLPSEQRVQGLQLLLEASAARARLLALRIQTAPPPQDITEQRTEADAAFTQAIQAAQRQATSLKTLLEDFHRQPSKDQDVGLRNAWRSSYLAAQIAVPTLLLESAQVRNDDPDEARKRLGRAIEIAREILDKYSASRPDAYLQTTLLLGRCYQAMEQFPEALARYQEILENETLPDRVSGLATQLAMECWSHPSQGKLDRALQQGEAWMRAHPRASVADKAPVQFALARCLLQKAESQSGDEQARSRSRARILLVAAARVPGPWRREAQQWLGNLPVHRDEPSGAAFATFADAKLAGDTHVGNMRNAEQSLEVAAAAQGNESSQSDPDLAAMRTERDEQRDRAIDAYRQALRHVGKETPMAEVLQVQFLLAYLLHLQGEDYDAAVLAEYIARWHSDSSQARGSVRLALAIYSRLCEQLPADQEPALRRLMKLANFAADRWSQDEEGQLAVVTLVRLLVARGQLDEARKYMDRIPETSTLRADAELTVGVALLREYRLIMSRDPPDHAKAEAIRQVAVEFLESGWSRSDANTVHPTAIVAALSLARVYLDQGDLPKARAILDDPKRGPYTLVRKNSPLMSDPSWIEDTYRTELRARLGSSGESSTPAANLQEVLDALRKQLGSTPDGQKRFVAILVGLVNDLRQQIQSMAKNQQAASIQAIVPLLTQIAENSNEIDVLLWSSHALAEMAKLITGQSPSDINRRKQILTAAILPLEKAQSNLASSPDAERRQQIQVQLANLKRRQGDYRGAIPLFAEVLAENPNLVNVQIDAAATYQEGGAYRYAIKGGRPDPKTQQNIIWGWERISVLLARQMKIGREQQDRFSSQFHEARYQIAFCRFQEALAATGETRHKYLEQARHAITTIAAMYPDLGGPEQKARYESLLKEIDLARNS